MRELHYTLCKDAPFTAEEIQSVESVVQPYNRAFAWPCEAFNFWIFEHRPRVANARRAMLAAEGISDAQIEDALRNEGLTCLTQNRNTEIEGSSCPGEDAYAFMLITGLLQLSLALPHIMVTIEDDGGLIRPPIYLRAGLAHPLYSRGRIRMRSLGVYMNPLRIPTDDINRILRGRTGAQIAPPSSTNPPDRARHVDELAQACAKVAFAPVESVTPLL